MMQTSWLKVRRLCPFSFGFLTAVPGSPLSPLTPPSPLSPHGSAQPSHNYYELSRKSLPLTTISFLIYNKLCPQQYLGTIMSFPFLSFLFLFLFFSLFFFHSSSAKTWEWLNEFTLQGFSLSEQSC